MNSNRPVFINWVTLSDETLSCLAARDRPGQLEKSIVVHLSSRGHCPSLLRMFNPVHPRCQGYFRLAQRLSTALAESVDNPVDNIAKSAKSLEITHSRHTDAGAA
jgi:hypothetical protein